MPKSKLASIIAAGGLLLLSWTFAQAQEKDCRSCHSAMKPGEVTRMLKMGAMGERGLGIMDKGQVANYLGNYGVLSNFHEYFNNAIHWPAAANTET